MVDTLFLLLEKFLKRENFKLNFEEFKLQLLSHPSYPSLHSVTGVLDHFGIENAALQVPVDMHTLEKLPDNFLSINNDGQYIVVAKHKNFIEIFSEDLKSSKLGDVEFIGNWQGVIVCVEKNDSKLVTVDSRKKLIERTMFIILSLGILCFFFIQKPSPFQTVHFLLSLLGVSMSTLIVKRELGFQSRMLDKFCDANEKISCDAVLTSGGATIFGGIKLSDVCLVYFLGILQTNMLVELFQTTPMALILATLIALPVTVYSLYYQMFIVKKWCPLCLCIVMVIWLQGFSLFLVNGFLIDLDLIDRNDLMVFIGILIPAILWTVMRPFVAARTELRKLSITHKKFIRNYDFFEAVLNKARFIDPMINDNLGNEIILGNVNAPLTLIVVTSPLCFYCKATHTDIENLLKRHPKDLNALIRFNINVDQREEIGNQTSIRLMELYTNVSKEQFHLAMHEAYASDVKLEKWLQKWNRGEHTSFKSILERQRVWCHENGIHFTPAIYLNGHEFPKEYELKDLSYFIEELREKFKIFKPNYINESEVKVII